MSFNIWQASIVDSDGRIMPAASVTVRLESTGALAALKADRDGTTPKANPFTADAITARAFFYAVAGHYKITATKDGFTQEWRDVPLGSAAATDTPAGQTREHTDAGDATVGPLDECLVIKKDVGENTDVIIPPAAERNGVDVIIKDGRGDAATFRIRPVFDGAETCDGLPGTSLEIRTNFGMLHMRPNTDGTGYYQFHPQL